MTRSGRIVLGLLLVMSGGAGAQTKLRMSVAQDLVVSGYRTMSTGLNWGGDLDHQRRDRPDGRYVTSAGSYNATATCDGNDTSTHVMIFRAAAQPRRVMVVGAAPEPAPQFARR